MDELRYKKKADIFGTESRYHRFVEALLAIMSLNQSSEDDKR